MPPYTKSCAKVALPPVTLFASLLNTLPRKVVENTSWTIGLAPGTPVSVTSDAAPGQVFRGTISAINPEIDSVTRSVRVRATIQNIGERLRPGHFRVSVMAPIASPIPDAKLAEQAVAMTRLINEQFEAWIRAAPDQWMCLKRRWPKARAESPVPSR